MAKLSIKTGTTSKSIDIFIQDSTSATGDGLTGLVYNTASLTAYYHRPGSASVAITLATLAAVTTSYSSGGFKEIDSTNMPGIYRLDLPDACLASGVTSVTVVLRGATNMVPVPLEIELTAVDNQDSVRFGITAVPNAVAGATGGLPTVDSSNAVKVQSGTGANQISLSSGTVTVGTNNDKTGYTASTVSDKTGYTVSTVSDKTGYSLSSDGNIAVLSQTLEGSYTVLQALKLIASVMCGNRSGGGTSIISFTGLDGSTTRVTLSVDSNGNSTADPVLVGS